MAVNVADLQATLRLEISQFQAAVAQASASADRMATAVTAGPTQAMQNMRTSAIEPTSKSLETLNVRFLDSERSMERMVRVAVGMSGLASTIAQIGKEQESTTAKGEAFLSVMSFIPGPIGLAAAAGRGFVEVLKSFVPEAARSSEEIGRLASDIGYSFQSTNLKIQEMDAKTNNDRVLGAQLAFRAVVMAAEKERDDLISSAVGANKVGTELEAIRTKANQAANDAIRLGAKQLKDDLIAYERERVAAVRDLQNELTTSAQARAMAEVRASGEVLAALEQEQAFTRENLQRSLAERVDALSKLSLEASDFAERRRLMEQSTLNQIVAAEVKAAADRREAIRGFVDGALALIEKLGPQFDEVAKKLTLTKELEETRTQLLGLTEAFKQAGIDGSELSRTIDATVDRLKELGATSQQALGTLPTSVREVKAQADALANSVVQVGDSFVQTRDMIDANTAALQRNRAAAQALEDTQTGHSLDTSTTQVGAAMQSLADDVSLVTDHYAANIAQADALLALMDSLEQSVVTVSASFDHLGNSAGQALAKVQLFGDRSLFPNSVNGIETSGPALTVGSYDAASLAAAASGLIRLYKGGANPAPMSPAEAAALLQPLLAQQAQQTAISNALQRAQTAYGQPGGGGFAAAPVINTTVNMNGLTMVQSQRAIQDLALTVSGLTADAAKRQGLTG